MSPGFRSHPRCIFTMAVLAFAMVGCDPETSSVVRLGDLRILSIEPALGNPLGASAVLKFSYEWDVRQAASRNSVLSLSMRFDRTDGGLRSWTLLDGEVRRSGVDSGTIFLAPEILANLERPVCGRLLMTETVQDSLVAFLAQSGDFCWVAN